MASPKPEPLTPHLAGLLNPAATLAGLWIGGPWAATGLVLVLVVYPLVDLVLGEAAPARAAGQASRLAPALPWLHGLSQLLMLAALARLVVHEGPTATSLLGCLSAGLHGGVSAIVTAHELGHRRPRSPGWRLARLLLFSVHYPHFTTEHNHGHHRLVATAADPASAPAGRGLWSHIARTIPAQWRSAAAVHTARGRRGLAHPVHRDLALQVLLLVLLGAAPRVLGLTPVLGLHLVLAWLLASLVAVLLLEYVNYLQHHGLRRAPDERQTAAHSWQSTARWSRWTLLELPLHADHHLHAARPFHELEALDDAPRLPAGYYACFWPAAFPPLWRRWRAPGLDEAAAGQSPFGRQPSR